MGATVDQDRVDRLHAQAIVVDSLGSAGPPTISAEALARAEQLWRAGASFQQVTEAMAKVERELWRRGVPERYLRDWAASGVTATSFTLGAFGERPFTYENAVRDLAEFTGRVDRCDALVKVLCAEDVRRCKRDGRYGLIFNFQNTDHLDGSVDALDFFYDFGLRVIQLTYNSRNFVGEGCTERTQGGLSFFGLEVVARMNELGILVDVSHSGEGTTLDAIERSARPVAITHSMASALNGHPRGKADHVIKEIGQAGGYFGVLLLPFFLAPDGPANLDTWLRHLDHVANLAGIDHVGIGTDTGGAMPPVLAEMANKVFGAGGDMGFRDDRVDLTRVTEGFEDWPTGWRNLTAALVRGGYSDEEILGILGGNFLRVFEQAVG